MICVYNTIGQRELSAKIQLEYFQLGNVKLLNRPQVSGQTLIDAGWTDAGTGTATVYSTYYTAGSEGVSWNHDVIIHLTPIKANGSVLTPSQLDSYVDYLLTGTTIASIASADNAGEKLLLYTQEVTGGWDAAEEDAEVYDDLLHRLQAVYYLEDYDEFPTIDELREFNSDISFYPSFDGNGDAVLMPTSGKVKMIAGGDYSFTMEHPIDPWGKWKFLKEEAIVKLPVPTETIENSFSGLEAYIYKTNQEAELRDDTSEPETITYDPFRSTSWTYVVGDKVTYNGKNYQCIKSPQKTEMGYNHPPDNYPEWWKEIARTTNGATVIATLPKGSELYFVEDVDGTWYKMSTYYGVQGYIKKSRLTYVRHTTPTENQPRTITEQLFRIREVSVDRDNGKVSVSGKHVSYDLNGNLIKELTISQASAAMAISRVMENLTSEYCGTIATNISDDEDTTFSGTFKMKNGMHCLIDPDAGIVPTFNAKFTRDNWDLFVMENNSPDRGLRIRYGKNVNGITWKRKTDSLVTRVIPKAKAADGSDLYLPEGWVDSEHVAEYSVIYMEYLSVSGQVGKDDGTNTDTVWTEEALLDEMRQKAQDRYDVDEADLPVNEITVQFEPLERTEEFSRLRGLMTVNLYDKVHVEDPEIGLEAEVKVSEIEYNYVARKITGIKLSNVQNSVTKTVTGYNITNGSIGSEKLKDDVITSTVETAKDETLTMVTNRETPVVDNLTSTSTSAALSANQGRVLDEKKADITVLSNISSTAKAFSIANSSRIILALIGPNASVCSLFLIATNSSGAMTVAEVLKGSAITYTTATRKITISNSTGNTIKTAAYVITGSIEDATT